MYVVDQAPFVNGVGEITTELSPLELLEELQDIERHMGRQKVVDKGPRNIDLDILLYDHLSMQHSRLTIPHPLMLEREFVLRPLCDLIPNGFHPSPHPLTTFQTTLQSLPGSESATSTLTPVSPSLPPLTPLAENRSTQVMAIVNVTPDSFSDGGDNFNVDVDALASSTMELLDVTGATIVDVGGQSSKPGAMEVSEEEELRRTVPMIRALRSAARTRPLCISIDTYRARVAAEAVGAGADLVNDVSGGTLDRAMLATVAKLGASICLTHMRGTPSTMTQLTQYPEGIVPTVARELSARVQAAEAAGIRRWRILVDPGIGFAKTQAQNLELLRDLHLLRDWSGLQGLPWLVGPSRKAFIGRITGVAEPRDRIWGTAAAISAAVAGGADIVRVHDVAHMAQVVKMADAIWRHGR